MIDLQLARVQGLMPVVLQDADTGVVLAIGLMNRAALQATLETGKLTLLNRSAARLFVARTTAGDPACVEEVRTDSDRDALLVRVRVGQKGLVCERGGSDGLTELVTSLELSGPSSED